MTSFDLAVDPPALPREPAARPFDDIRLARARIVLTYLWGHRRFPDLHRALRFTEMVQLRKLHDRSAALPVLMDKIAAKALASEVLGPEWTIPTAWSGTRLPDDPPFAMPAILKARHGCNQNIVFREAPTRVAWQIARTSSTQWVKRPYGKWLDEWAYRDVPRGLIAEPLVGDGPELPVDYKIYVFGGQATHVQVHLGRGRRHRWILHDRDWQQLIPCGDAPPPPDTLSDMLSAAEALARDVSFLRVDFYEVAGRPLFGEFCLYPGSGLDPFAADWIDFELGTLWANALCALRVDASVRRAPDPVKRGPFRWAQSLNK